MIMIMKVCVIITNIVHYWCVSMLLLLHLLLLIKLLVLLMLMLLVLMWCELCGQWIWSGEGSVTWCVWARQWDANIWQIEMTTHINQHCARHCNGWHWLPLVNTDCHQPVMWAKTCEHSLHQQGVHSSLRSKYIMCLYLGMTCCISRSGYKSVFKCSNT